LIWKSKTDFSRPLRGLNGEIMILVPAINRWAIFIRPLRGLVEGKLAGFCNVKPSGCF
jgi:hypothetical protein